MDAERKLAAVKRKLSPQESERFIEWEAKYNIEAAQQRSLVRQREARNLRRRRPLQTQTSLVLYSRSQDLSRSLT